MKNKIRGYIRQVGG